MIQLHRLIASAAGIGALAASGFGQIPDLLNAFDAGGRSLGMGGSLHGTDPSSMSAYYNPASLGYITQGEVDLALHNLPNSTTVITNSRSNPAYQTVSHSGNDAVTDIGVAMPVKALFGKGKASVALSYNIGGYIHDVAVGPSTGLPDNELTLQNYALTRAVRSDFVTLAYGQSTPSKTFSFGFGLIYAATGTQYLESASAVDANGTSVPFPGTNINYQSQGVGFIVGAQVIPSSIPNLSLGASYRTPIGLNAGEYSGVYDRIPARFLADASYRIDGGFSGSDFTILGAQYQYFNDGDASLGFNRSDQNVFGVGFEYNHLLGNFRVPVRIGYESASDGGVGFDYRRILTYGFGLRPADSKFSLDFNWSTMDNGGKDFGISAGYRFGQ